MVDEMIDEGVKKGRQSDEEKRSGKEVGGSISSNECRECDSGTLFSLKEWLGRMGWKSEHRVRTK